MVTYFVLCTNLINKAITAKNCSTHLIMMICACIYHKFKMLA